jgi:hypothetical protein
MRHCIRGVRLAYLAMASGFMGGVFVCFFSCFCFFAPLARLGLFLLWRQDGIAFVVNPPALSALGCGQAFRVGRHTFYRFLHLVVLVKLPGLQVFRGCSNF